MDPTAWKLVTIDRGGESKYLEARVEALLDNQVVTDLLMKKMVVRVVTKESGEVLEEATFQTQVTSSTSLLAAEFLQERGKVEILAISCPDFTKPGEKTLSARSATQL